MRLLCPIFEQSAEKSAFFSSFDDVSARIDVFSEVRNYCDTALADAQVEKVNFDL